MEILNDDLALLISFNDDIATISDGQSLFITILNRLKRFYKVNVAGLAIYDKIEKNLGLTIAQVPEDDDILNSYAWLQTFSKDTIPFDLDITSPKITYVSARHFLDMNKANEEIPPFEFLINEYSIKEFVFIPVRTGGVFVGYLIFLANELNLKIKDEDYFLKIANLIGSAINNISAFEEVKRKQKENEMQLNLLVDLVTVKDINTLHIKLANEINKLVPSDYIALIALQKDTNTSIAASSVKDKSGNFSLVPITRNITLTLTSLAAQNIKQSGINNFEISGSRLDKLSSQFSHIRQLKENNSIRSFLVLKYSNPSHGEINLILGRTAPYSWLTDFNNLDFVFSPNINQYFANKEIELAQRSLPLLGLILANIYAFEEISVLTKRLEQEKNFLLEEINISNNFQEIIGNSQPIQNVLNKVTLVAPLDATVLILGETGTGKELIARAVHNLSKRKENAFITVNCAALPAQLIESELFGHEKGSFTGAIEKRIGKFEVANGGTIFLDEIGELPMEIQAKLLRVLQEKEFERLGGKSTIKSDVRIIAATNRDLESEVQQGKFRADLFFRLNVFPILVPPLRERNEDIPLLVKYFIDKYSKRIGKNVTSISKKDIDILTRYNWPGNIRELEHMTERAIIISEGTNLSFEKLLSGSINSPEVDVDNFKTLELLEKEHIINALKLAKGKITGENSAAQLLGINGKTLGSRMRKLGIKREIIITV